MAVYVKSNPYISFFFIFLLFVSVPARTIGLSGRVFDASSKSPLAGANVFLKQSHLGVSTDADGYFRLSLAPISMEDSLTITYMGYQTFSVALKNFQNKSIIYLLPKRMLLEQEIIVTGSRGDLLHQDIPHAKNILKAEEIQQNGSNEISDLLKPVASVRIEGNDLDGRKIQIRGSNSDEVNVYLDGVLINELSFDNAADLSIIPLENIERIEVVKGGALALLGNGAFGGVVNVTSRQNLNTSFFLKAKMGDFNTRYLTGSFSVPLSKNTSGGYFFQLGRFKPDIEYFPGERYSLKSKNNHIQTEKQNHHLYFNYFFKDARINAKFINYSLSYIKPKWESHYKNYLSIAGFSGRFFNLGPIQVQVSEHYSDNSIQRQPTGSSRYISSYESNRLNVRISKKVAVKDGHIQFLTEYMHSDLKTDTKVKDVNWQTNLYHAFIFDNRLSTAAVFSYKDHPKNLSNISWETFIGLRGDFPASGNSAFTNMIGARLNYTTERWQISPYLNYGKNVKYPSLTQMAYTRDLSGLSQKDSTFIRLEPEYSRAFEGGFSATYFPSHAIYHNFECSAGLFSRTIYNSIIQRPFDDLIARVQQGRATINGFESALKFNHIFSYFYGGASFIVLDIDNPLLYAYKPQTNSAIHFGFVLPFGFYLSSTYFYEGKSTAWFFNTNNDIQTTKIPSFEDMDITLGYKHKLFNTIEMDGQISGKNIFDNSGFKYYYLKKRFLVASLSLRY